MAETTEQEEAQRAAGSPLALVFELLGCEYASMVLPEGRVIPEYHFTTVPCPFGKSQPDQDCRECRHHRVLRHGADQVHAHRYQGYGKVIPVTEAQAQAVEAMLATANTRALRRPAWEAHHAAQQAAIAERHAQEAEAAAKAQRQTGRHAQPVRRRG